MRSALRSKSSASVRIFSRTSALVDAIERRTDAEYRRLLEIVERITEKPEEEIGEEEGRPLELLGVLIENYEDRTHPLPVTQPHKMLAHLLEEKGMSASDLSQVLPKSRVS